MAPVRVDVKIPTGTLMDKLDLRVVLYMFLTEINVLRQRAGLPLLTVEDCVTKYKQIAKNLSPINPGG